MNTFYIAPRKHNHAKKKSSKPPLLKKKIRGIFAYPIMNKFVIY